MNKATSMLIALAVLLSCSPTVFAGQSDLPRVNQAAPEVQPTSDTIAFFESTAIPVISVTNAQRLNLISTIKPANTFKFSGDSQHLAISGKHGISVYSASDFHLITVLDEEHDREYRSYCMSHDGSMLAYDIPNRHQVVIWKLDEDREEMRLTGTSNPKGFSPDGRMLVTHGDKFQVWDIKKDSVLFEQSGKDGVFSTSPDWNIVAQQMADVPIRVEVHDIDGGAVIDTLTGFTTAAPVWSAKFSPDWKYLMWISRATISLMNVAAKEFLPDPGPYSNAVFSPDSKFFAGAEAGWIYAEPYLGRIAVYSFEAQEITAELEDEYHPGGMIFSPFGDLLVSWNGQDTSNLVIWDWNRGKVINRLTCVRDGYPVAWFSPDGKLLVVMVDHGYEIWAVTD